MRLRRNAKPVLTRWQLKQELAKPSRYYGDGGTIHSSGQVDVEVDANGQVVAVWFRCQPLPFRQSTARDARAIEMRNMYREGVKCTLTGVEIRDADTVPRD